MTLQFSCPNTDLWPLRATAGSAGWDLRADIPEPVTLGFQVVSIIPTGVHVAIPRGYVGEIRPRSSLGAKGIIIPNSPGTIDSDYRGELKVELLKVGGDNPYAGFSYTIHPLDRIAQLVVVPCYDGGVWMTGAPLEEDTGRGSGGFGSTGR